MDRPEEAQGNSSRYFSHELEERKNFWLIPSAFNNSLNISTVSITDSDEVDEDEDPRNQSMNSVYSFESNSSANVCTSLAAHCSDFFAEASTEKKAPQRSLKAPLVLSLPDHSDHPARIAFETPMSVEERYFTPHENSLPTPTREGFDSFGRLCEKSAKTPFCDKSHSHQPYEFKQDPDSSTVKRAPSSQIRDDAFAIAQAMLALSNPERTRSHSGGEEYLPRSTDSKRSYSELSTLSSSAEKATSSPFASRNNLQVSDSCFSKKDAKRCKTQPQCPKSTPSNDYSDHNKENQEYEMTPFAVSTDRLAKTIIANLREGDHVVRTTLEKGTLLMVLSESIEDRYFGKERLQKFCQKCTSRDEYNVTSKQWSRMKLKVIAELILTILADRLQGKLPPKTTPTRPLWVRNYGEALGRLLLSQDQGILRMPPAISADNSRVAIDVQVFTAVFGDSGTTGRTFRSRKAAPRSVVPFDFSGGFDPPHCSAPACCENAAESPMELEE